LGASELASHCPFDTLARKFRATVRCLQSWNQKKVRHANSQLALAREVLHQLEIAQDSRGLCRLELWVKNKLKPHCLALSSLQPLLQEADLALVGSVRVMPIQSLARHQKRKNFISKLTTDDWIVLTKHEEDEQNIFYFYSNLLGKSIGREVKVNLLELDMPKLISVSWMHLSLKKSRKQLTPYLKAPSPDASQANSIRCAGRP